MVGDDAGNVYGTQDGGESWTDLAWDSTITAIQDIVFVNDEVGYVAGTTAAPAAQIQATWNGGEIWTTSEPRILNTPTFDRCNRIAVPLVDNQNVAVNNVMLAGLAGNGSDGVLFGATAAQK